MIRQLFSGILARKFSKLPIDPAQRAFKKEEGCAIKSYNLRAVVNQYITNRKELSYVFLAFDSVSHQALTAAYRRAKISERGISLLKELYRGNFTQFSSDESSSRIAITSGVLQGDPLSPILFNLVLDEACAVLKEYIGARLNGVE